MSDKTCPICERPTTDGLACWTCISAFRRQVETLPELMRRLAETVTRQDRVTEDKGHRAASEVPLPFNLTATIVRDSTVNTIGTWIRELNLDTTNLATNMRAWCNLLVDNMAAIRRHRDVDELVDEVTYAIDDVKRAIDQPAHMEFYGQCTVCNRDLYGAADANEVLCRYCDRAGIEARYPTAGRRAGLWQTAPDALVPRRVALAALPVWGMQVAPSTFHGWVREGKIEPRHDEDRPNAVLYRLGDVLDLATSMETQEQTRQVIGWNLTKETMAG